MKGFISPQVSVPGVIDEETGIPVGGGLSFETDYECEYFPTTLSNKGVNVGGKFEQSEYEITVYDMNFSASFIRLKNRKGDVLCEREVKSIMELEAIQRIKVIV